MSKWDLRSGVYICPRETSEAVLRDMILKRDGNEKRGRPKFRMKEVVKEDIKERDILKDLVFK
jgi:hypothetical protein